MKMSPYSPVHSDLQFPVQPDLQSGWIEYKDLLSAINVCSMHFSHYKCSYSYLLNCKLSNTEYFDPPEQPDLQSGWIEYKDLLSVINVCSMYFSHYKCSYSHLLNCKLSNTEYFEL